jgi:hypothetical protein
MKAPGSRATLAPAAASHATTLRITVLATLISPYHSVRVDSDTHPYASVAGSEVRRWYESKVAELYGAR